MQRRLWSFSIRSSFFCIWQGNKYIHCLIESIAESKRDNATMQDGDPHYGSHASASLYTI